MYRQASLILHSSLSKELPISRLSKYLLGLLTFANKWTPPEWSKWVWVRAMINGLSTFSLSLDQTKNEGKLWMPTPVSTKRSFSDPLKKYMLARFQESKYFSSILQTLWASCWWWNNGWLLMSLFGINCLPHNVKNLTLFLCIVSKIQIVIFFSLQFSKDKKKPVTN